MRFDNVRGQMIKRQLLWQISIERRTRAYYEGKAGPEPEGDERRVERAATITRLLCEGYIEDVQEWECKPGPFRLTERGREHLLQLDSGVGL